MRIDECGVEHRTAQRVNQLFLLFTFLSFCLFYDIVRSYIVIIQIFFETMDRLFLDSKDEHHHVLRMKYKYGVLPAYAQKCTRRTHTVSCGWSMMCIIWCAMSHTFEHSWYPLHALCSYKNCAATSSLLLGIFSGLIFLKRWIDS